MKTSYLANSIVEGDRVLVTGKMLTVVGVKHFAKTVKITFLNGTFRYYPRSLALTTEERANT